MIFTCESVPPEPSRVSQLTLVPSPFCRPCPARGICREQFTALGCPPSGPVHPNLLHPRSNEWFKRIAEVNGFAFDYPAKQDHIPVLPAYVPAVRPNAWRNGLPSSAAFAIPLSHAASLARKAEEQGITAKRLLGLTDQDLLIVLGFANDHFLERHWPPRERRRLLASIKFLAPDAAVAWGYSVWHRHVRGWIYPRIEHLYNLKRSLKVYAELQAFGIPAIPHVYWGTHEDLDRWAVWLAENPTVTTLAVDLQTVDQPPAWRDAFDALGYLRSLLPRPLRLLISGVCRAERVLALRQLWPESALSNFGASFASTLHHKRLYGLPGPWIASPSQWSTADIFQHVASQYSMLGSTGEPDHLQDGLRRDHSAPWRTPDGAATASESWAAQRRRAVGQREFGDVDEQWRVATARSVA